MGLTFRTKLLASYVALVVAVVALGSFELNRSLGQDLVQQLDERLHGGPPAPGSNGMYL